MRASPPVPLCAALCLAAALLAPACDGEGGSPSVAASADADPSDTNGSEVDSVDAPDASEPTPDTVSPVADVAGPDVVEPSPDVEPPPKDGPILPLTMDAFTVQPGSERQVCRTINLPVDEPIDVVAFHATMEGVSHHFNLYKVIDDKAFEPVSEYESSVHDCSPADEQLSGDAAYMFGSATPTRTMTTPPGVAFHLEPGQRLILEQHVINYTLEPIEGGVLLELEGASPDDVVEHHADIIWFATWAFALLPGLEASKTDSCKVPYDVEVFGLMSHFHELGTLFTVEHVPAGGEAVHVYEDDDWAHPEYREYQPPLSLAAGDALRWTCNWFNYKDKFVGPGPLSTDEMCILFAAAYPKNTLSGDPIQCNKYSF